MKLHRIEVYDVRIPLREPFRIALGVIREVETIIVRLTDDAGHEGWGEAAPDPHVLSSTPTTTIAALGTIAPLLLGAELRGIGALTSMMDEALAGNSAAKAAVDIAAHDLLGQAVGLPIWRLLGGERAVARPVPTAYSLGIAEIGEILAKARHAAALGIRTIKVKVGLDVARDIEVVTALRHALGPEIELTVDANQGWSRTDAVKALEKMAKSDVAFAEQPVIASDVEGLAWVRSRTSVPIMADESVHSPRDALRVARADAADFMNIKLMKTGGLEPARAISTIADAAGIPCMVGSMSESNLAVTAGVHFALARRGVRLADLEVGTREEMRLFTEGGVVLRDGDLALVDPEAPGLGLSGPIRERLGAPIATFRQP